MCIYIYTHIFVYEHACIYVWVFPPGLQDGHAAIRAPVVELQLWALEMSTKELRLVFLVSQEGMDPIQEFSRGHTTKPYIESYVHRKYTYTWPLNPSYCR